MDNFGFLLGKVKGVHVVQAVHHFFWSGENGRRLKVGDTGLSSAIEDFALLAAAPLGRWLRIRLDRRVCQNFPKRTGGIVPRFVTF